MVVKLAADAVEILMAVTFGSGLTSLSTVADAVTGGGVAVSDVRGYIHCNELAKPIASLKKAHFRRSFPYYILLPRRFPVLQRCGVTDGQGSNKVHHKLGEHLRLDECL